MKISKTLKIHLFLIEAMILIVVFAIASTMIIPVFFKGNEMRVKSQLLNESILYAQNVVEAVRVGEDFEKYGVSGLMADVQVEDKELGAGKLEEITVSIKDSASREVIYEIETGIYRNEGK